MTRSRVLFVCLGNICRSPTAEAIMLHKIAEAGLNEVIEVDSAGTGDWHIGEAPDERARQCAALHGYDLEPLRARQVEPADFQDFDLILAMDEANLRELRRLCPPEFQSKVQLLMEYAPQPAERVVPDPYFGGLDGFERVLEACEQACTGLLSTLQRGS
ncbi:low molecular weight protein-tyrosine-phosphatase [Pararobbsia alpina]|uniref:protein-tyrosine-phosphatase n=1 Tax=Pararobbsia alpina TaxID=621374 RepID=A0A6S7BAW7_9BURK|nr:low molecular weight protein-tyrosine-phosphatase [Pararobbsia alpina]CAB3784112.1 Putative low molecular weight protein-tyrosine-phosphatase [Pararobbsia alpina]